MIWETPLGTVWPAFLALLVWLWAGRGVVREVRLPSGWWILAAVGVVVRLVWIPSMQMHQFDGHEAEYWDLFRGFREPSRGGTVMVPAMQWFWWLSGLVLPESHGLVILISVTVGLIAIGLYAGAIGQLFGARLGWVVGGLLACNPTHAAWSSSAYNVILPHMFGAVAVYAAAVSVRRVAGPGPWAWLAASSLALSAALRMDSATVSVLVVGLVLMVRPPSTSVLERVRQWFLPGTVSVMLTALCVWPLIWPGQLPGAGERGLSFGLNVNFFDVYHPFHTSLGWVLVAGASLFGVIRNFKKTLPFLLVLVVHHMVMATFDDFGERHVMVTIPALVGLVAIGMAEVGRLGWLGIVVVLAMQVADLQDLRERFYGSEDTYISVLNEPQWSDLPRKAWEPSLPGQCGWVAEDSRVARKPATSHFNLLNPAEEKTLRGENGCLLWCVDVQDWRWSSRGVRDRALRLAHLFSLRPAFVVAESTTGYGCVVMEVGPRRHSVTETNDGNHTTVPRGNQSIP